MIAMQGWNRTRGMSPARRRILLGAGASVLVVGAGATVALQRLRLEPPPLDVAAEPQTLIAREMTVIVALAETLVPARHWIGPEETERLITRAIADTPGLSAAYQDGAVLLEDTAQDKFGEHFAALSVTDRHTVVEELVWMFGAEFGETTPNVRGATRIRGLRRRVERTWLDESRRRFRDLVMSDLLERLYLAAAPCLLGYTNTQGVPGGPRAYVDPPAPAGQVCVHAPQESAS